MANCLQRGVIEATEEKMIIVVMAVVETMISTVTDVATKNIALATTSAANVFV